MYPVLKFHNHSRQHVQTHMAGEEIGTGEVKGEESRQKLVFTGLCIDFLIIIPETIAAFLASSMTLFADVIKCVNEMLATSFALIIIRRVTLGGKFTYDYGMGMFESLTRIITGVVMFASLAILLYFTIRRLGEDEVSDILLAAQIGVPLMIFASIADAYHWRKNHRLAQRALPHHGGPVASPAGQDLLGPADPRLAGTVMALYA